MSKLVRDWLYLLALIAIGLVLTFDMWGRDDLAVDVFTLSSRHLRELTENKVKKIDMSIANQLKAAHASNNVSKSSKVSSYIASKTNYFTSALSPKMYEVGKLVDLADFLTQNGSRPARNIIITLGASNYKPVVHNWVGHMEKMSIHNYIVICADREIYRELDPQHAVLMEPPFKLNLTYVKAKRRISKMHPKSSNSLGSGNFIRPSSSVGENQNNVRSRDRTTARATKHSLKSAPDNYKEHEKPLADSMRTYASKALQQLSSNHNSPPADVSLSSGNDRYDYKAVQERVAIRQKVLQRQRESKMRRHQNSEEENRRLLNMKDSDENHNRQYYEVSEGINAEFGFDSRSRNEEVDVIDSYNNDADGIDIYDDFFIQGEGEVNKTEEDGGYASIYDGYQFRFSDTDWDSEVDEIGGQYEDDSVDRQHTHRFRHRALSNKNMPNQKEGKIASPPSLSPSAGLSKTTLRIFDKRLKQLGLEKGFNILMVLKHSALLVLLSAGHSVVWSDIDCIWVKQCAADTVESISKSIFASDGIVDSTKRNIRRSGNKPNAVQGKFEMKYSNKSTVEIQRLLDERSLQMMKLSGTIFRNDQYIDLASQQGLYPGDVSAIIGTAVCTGFFVINPTPASILLISTVRTNIIKLLSSNKQGKGDQKLLNHVLVDLANIKKNTYANKPFAYGPAAVTGQSKEHHNDLSISLRAPLATTVSSITNSATTSFSAALLGKSYKTFPFKLRFLAYDLFPRGDARTSNQTDSSDSASDAIISSEPNRVKKKLASLKSMSTAKVKKSVLEKELMNAMVQKNADEWSTLKDEACIWHMYAQKTGQVKVESMRRDGVFYSEDDDNGIERKPDSENGNVIENEAVDGGETSTAAAVNSGLHSDLEAEAAEDMEAAAIETMEASST